MFDTLVCFSHSATLTLKIGDGLEVKIQLSEQEGDTIRSMCEQFYYQRQSQIAQAVACPVPALADFSEVE